MGRIVEVLVALNAAGGILTYWSIRQRTRRRRRKAALEQASQSLEAARKDA